LALIVDILAAKICKWEYANILHTHSCCKLNSQGKQISLNKPIKKTAKGNKNKTANVCHKTCVFLKKAKCQVAFLLASLGVENPHDFHVDKPQHVEY